MSGRWAAMVLLISASASAAGRGPAKSTQSEMGLGMALFLNGDFRGALLHFNAALAEAHGSTEAAQVHLLRGECFTALGDQPDARRAFELALDQDSEVQLDPSHVPPETVNLLGEVRSGLHAELTLLGSGASATLDGASIGPLPIHQQIAIGRHALDVSTPDKSFDEKQQIVARPGDSIALTFDVPSAARAASTADAGSAAAGAPLSAEVSQGAGPAPSPLGVFGSAGALIDPLDKAAAFEASAGFEYGILFGSVAGLWGAAAGIAPRVGVASPSVLGPVGLYACAEVPIFFASGAQAGLGVQAGVSWRWGIFEPYAGLSGQHFFSAPGSAPANYFLVPVGLRVFIP